MGNMKQNIDKIESEDKREERQELKPMHGSQNTEMDSSKEKTLQRKIDKTKEKMREAKQEQKREDERLRKMNRNYWQHKQKEPKSPIEIGMMQSMNNLKLQNKKMQLKEKQKHLMQEKQTIQTTNEQRMKKQRDQI